MKKIKLQGVTLSRSNKQRKENISGINWLDMKISKFVDNCKSEKFLSSKNAIKEFCEIIGILEFLYMSRTITLDEYNLICDEMTKDVLKEDEEHETV